MGWEGCDERVRPAAEFLMFIITSAFLTFFVVFYFGLARFYILLGLFVSILGQRLSSLLRLQI